MANTLNWTFNLIDHISGPANRMNQALGTVNTTMSRVGAVAGGATRILGGVAAAGVGVATALYGAAAAAGAGAVSMLSNAENTRISLAAMLGSTEKATNAMQYAVKVARETPFEVSDVISSMQRLLQQGFNPKQIDPILRGFADMGAQLGMTGADMQDMITIMGQIKMKPNLQGEELLQFAERGVPIYKMLSQQLGITEGDVIKLASAGKISGTTAVAALTRGMQMFQGASQRNATTLSGLISTIKSIPQEFFIQLDIQSARGGGDLLAPVRTLLSNIATIFDFSKEPGASIFKEAGGAISSLITAIFGPLATSSDPAKAGKVVLDFVNNVKSFASEIAPLGDAVMKSVRAIFPVVVQVVKAIWPLVKGIALFTSALVSGEGGTSKFSQAGLAVRDVLKAVGEWFMKVWTMAKPVLSDLWTIVQGVFTLIKAAWDAVLWPVLQAIGQTFVAVWGIISPVLTFIWNLFRDVVAGVAAIIRGDWKGAFDAMANIVSSIWTAITGVFGGIINFITTTAASWWNALVNIGSNIVNGIIDGITSGIAWIGQTIADLGNTAVNGLKNLLGIKSPSKVFEDIGMQSALGMQRGLEGGLNGVASAGQKLANGALPNSINMPSLTGTGAYTVNPMSPTMPSASPVAVKGGQGGGGGIQGPVNVNVTVNANSSEPRAIAEQVKTIAVGAVLEALESAAMGGGLWQTSS